MDVLVILLVVGYVGYAMYLKGMGATVSEAARWPVTLFQSFRGRD